MTDVGYSPNSEYLATTSWDGTARVWELPEGREVARISFEGASTSKEDALDAIAFVSGGEYLATARVDGTAQIWQWRPQDLIDEACSRLSRNLTRKEWSLYLGDEPYRETCRNLLTDYGVEEYVTGEFKPAFSFELGKDWIVAAPETTNELSVWTLSEGNSLIFTKPVHVFDPSSLSDPLSEGTRPHGEPRLRDGLEDRERLSGSPPVHHPQAGCRSWCGA